MKNIYSVENEAKGLSLRLFIKKKYPDLSAKDVEGLLSKNGCKLNSAIERFGSKKLYPGDKVEIFPRFLRKKAEEKMAVLFEDEHLLVINKPSGITSSQSELRRLLGQTVFLVHRLDKQTSGVLILAKSQEAQAKMEAIFFNREIQKHYLAIVHGRISEKRGVIEKPMKLKSRYEGGAIYKTVPFGKEAKTLWEKAFSSKKETLLILKPITGRTHQIRVHLDSIEHPILGDPVYKSCIQSSYHAERLMLHSRKICFQHPFSHKKIEIIAPIPIIIRQVISKLFKNQSKCAY